MRSNHGERDKVSKVKLKLLDIDRKIWNINQTIPTKCLNWKKKNSLNNKPAGVMAGAPLTITNTAGKSQKVNMYLTDSQPGPKISLSFYLFVKFVFAFVLVEMTT